MIKIKILELEKLTTNSEIGEYQDKDFGAVRFQLYIERTEKL